MGKTTCAAASALGLAEQGSRVLAVSTDPAHSLGDALGARLTAEPTPVAVRRGALAAAELDAGRALTRWLGTHRADLEILAERGSWLDREDVRRLLGLSLPGIDELIGLIELLRLARENPADAVVVDTAPTAHTLRLLAAPGGIRDFAAALERMQERHRVVAASLGGAWHPDASDAVLDELDAEGRELEELLRDPRRTTLSWVLLPEALSFAETRDAVGSLEATGLPVAELIVNRVLPPAEGGTTECALCAARREAERGVIAEIQAAFPEKAIRYLRELPREPRGAAALRKVALCLGEPSCSSPLGVGQVGAGGRVGRGPARSAKTPKPLDSKVSTKRAAPLLASPLSQPHPAQGGGILPAVVPPATRLLFFGGKGGVGKTTCAAAAALLLAEQRPGDRILLLSTDPAHSLADVLATPLGDDERPVPGAPAALRARELDAARTFDAWRTRHFESEEGEGEPEDWRDLLALAPPGLDELSAVSELADAIQQGKDAPDLVVVDTAPTGHALRLLEAPELMLEWSHALLTLLLKYREAVGLGRLAEDLVDLSRRLKLLIRTLHDPAVCRFLVVTRPAELPRRETVRLLASLDRLRLAAPAVVVNAVLPGDCSVCLPASRRQRTEIRRLRQELRAGVPGRSRGCAMIEAPALPPPPRGAAVLADWGRSWEMKTA